MRAASFVGYLIERGLLSHELARQHLIKPLISHGDNNYHRASAIHQLFHTAGNTLLCGLLEPEDVQTCFEVLGPWIGRIGGLDAVEMQVGLVTILVLTGTQLVWSGISRDPCRVAGAEG